MPPRWVREQSLSIKVVVLFGAAITAIVLAALSLPLARMQRLVYEGELTAGRELVSAWRTSEDRPAQAAFGDARVQDLTLPEAIEASAGDEELAEALRIFAEGETDWMGRSWEGWTRRYRYIVSRRGGEGELLGATILERESEGAAMLAAVNSLYALGAGSVVLAVALVVFYTATSRLILRPVRSLRLWAESVRDGNLDERSDVATGDEFQQLAETFNLMLDELQDQQRQLRAINVSMDVKLNELAEANEVLDRLSRRKGEFVANVSHELRTPLNSIIGFADLLLDLARDEAREAADAGGEPPPGIERRQRYLENIVAAARGLLGLIEGLLEMARIEAGKAELDISTVNVGESCRGMVAIMMPLAERRGVAVRIEPPSEPIMARTDARRFQQIVFNLLSNAVKFTPPSTPAGEPGLVICRVERLQGAADQGPRARVSVLDNGPGIPEDDQERIFEKYQQIRGDHAREHAGVGLGLAICKELAGVLQGELQLVSSAGRGSMFSVIIPLEIDPERAEESKLEAKFRGALASRRVME